jgi:uncharacterized protein (DUF169 family)
MTWQADTADLVELLHLEHAPIGVSREGSAPAGVARADRELASACAYWREGERRLIYATADDHKNCPIGMMVMGFDPPQAVADEAQILVGNMAELGYLDPAEVAHLPMLPKGHDGILYGPVAQFRQLPELVLIICEPGQAMLLSESLGQASLLPDSGHPVGGRPACGVLSRALLGQGAEMSFACQGARVLAELSLAEMLVAVPGARLEQATAALRVKAEANDNMAEYYNGRKRTFASI